MWWTKPPSSARRGAAPRALCTAAALLATGLLGACAEHAPPQAAPAFHAGPTPLDDFKPRLVHAPDEVALAVHASGLSQAQRLALQGLVLRWHEAGGAISLRAPAGAVDAGTIGAFAAAVSDHLQALGVPGARLTTRSYAATDPEAPLIVGFLVQKAEGPDCSFPWENLSATRTNAVNNHFGCATAADTAAMLAYPSDLAGAASMTSGDATRREYALGRYREGKATSAERDDQAVGSVSSVK